MNIMMLGCSYGVPNFYGPPGDSPETHISKLLSDAGHTIINLSENGGSNLRVFEKTKKYVSGEENAAVLVGQDKYDDLPPCPKIDCIIWFCTSFLRDHNKEGDQTSVQLIHLEHKVYQTIHEIRKMLHWPKLIAIGGCGPVNEQMLSDYGEVYHCMPDWRASLLNASSTCHFSGAINRVHEFHDDHLLDYLDIAQNTIDLMGASDLFPDGGHPGAIAHAELFDQIIPVLNSIENDK